MARLRGLLDRDQARYGSYKYESLQGDGGGSYEEKVKSKYRKRFSDKSSPVSRKTIGLLVMVLILAVAAVLLITSSSAQPSSTKLGCDSVQKGYQCRTQVSHFWGHYSPFYSVDSEISPEIPSKCAVSFAQVLSRHGARNPTASKSKLYSAVIQKIHDNAKSYPGKYAFLKDYQYSLDADQLTLFGQQEMVNSGARFYQRYNSLANHLAPFIRTASEDRVFESAQNWTKGFYDAKQPDKSPSGSKPSYPYPMVVISEADGQNNTLNHGLCTSFENGPDSLIATNAQNTWANAFAPSIQQRINSDLGGADLTLLEIVYLMDQCPFHTVASPNGTISPFCDLFTKDEWHQYDYYQTLNKYYGYSYGNPLGPTQGVGFTNELIARLTNKSVHDMTSVNHTIDDDPKTFPLGRQLYADFSHDNDMTAIFSAMGLYEGTVPLSNTSLTEAPQANGYSSAWTVPFGARAYFEKLTCAGFGEEQVRVIINDRVLPLKQCDGDNLGRCSLSKFIDSLTFARSGGHWDQCFL